MLQVSKGFYFLLLREMVSVSGLCHTSQFHREKQATLRVFVDKPACLMTAAGDRKLTEI